MPSVVIPVLWLSPILLHNAKHGSSLLNFYQACRSVLHPLTFTCFLLLSITARVAVCSKEKMSLAEPLLGSEAGLV